MRLTFTTLLLSFMLIVTGVARGSQDRTLPVTEIRLTAAAIDDTGAITVTAKVDGDDWKALQIEAYGKSFTLDEKQLATLKGFPPQSLKITYGNYKTGGDEMAVHVDLRKTIFFIVSDAAHPARAESTRTWITVTTKHGLEMGTPTKEAFIPNESTTQFQIIELH